MTKGSRELGDQTFSHETGRRLLRVPLGVMRCVWEGEISRIGEAVLWFKDGEAKRGQ